MSEIKKKQFFEGPRIAPRMSPATSNGAKEVKRPQKRTRFANEYVVLKVHLARQGPS